MVDDAFGLAMEDGANLEVALEFAKGFFDFEKVFVVGPEKPSRRKWRAESPTFSGPILDC
jgi:hypothetical protein